MIDGSSKSLQTTTSSKTRSFNSEFLNDVQNHFDSSLMFQSHEFLQDSAPCIIKPEENAKVHSDIMWINNF